MKLHLGCGEKHIDGFFHIDGFNHPNVDHVTSLDDLSFIQSETVDLIYSSHVLEHFKRERLKSVLKEWIRVLKKGGVLRVAVPDFEAICKVYSKNKNLKEVIGPLYGGQNYLYNIHYNTFDFSSLKKILEECGLSSVRRYDWRKTEHSTLDDFSQAYIPHMDKENGILISLNLEATKT